MKKVTSILTIFTLLMLMVPATVLAQEPAACEFDYTVQAGDWLSKITEKYYGDVLAYSVIVEANNSNDDYSNIDNPDVIEPGLLLCIPADGDAATGPAPAPAGLEQEALANATYQSAVTQDGTATLVNGEYSEEAAPGSASKNTVMLTNNIAYGELNGQPVAAVVLVSSGGGSGTFYDLALMVNQGGTPTNITTASLGDRVQINSVTVENDQVKVDMVQAGPDDGLCCPTQQVIKTLALQGEQLVELSSEEVSQADSGSSSSGLAGSDWLLATLNGQPALSKAPITAKFGSDGTVEGTSGCNSYGAGYETEGNNLIISFGSSTRIACEDAINQQETDFQLALGATTSYQIEGDSLTLSDVEGNTLATFSRMPEVELAGTSWNVIAYNNGKGGVVSIIIDTELTAIFDTDGSLTGSSGCNNYSTSYETDSDSITISPLFAATQKLCSEPEGIVEQEQTYLTALTTAATFSIELNRMKMRTAAGSLVGTFELAQ